MKKYIFEIRNTKTHAAVSTTATTYNAAIKALGWKPQDCRLCWKCPVQAGCLSTEDTGECL